MEVVGRGLPCRGVPDGGAAARRARQAAPGRKDSSEGSLADAGDLALVGQLTEADTAHAVVTQVSVGTAAELAAVVLPGGVLGRTLLLDFHRSLSHLSLPP